ncbi:MarR family winged helix-turn-helix transcriptional regulator [Streptomyces beijiangensis]|uniref:MarR family transcriptional regulator n=1 Tax=Streptomyces beijiangensis TaxID=163361 RepID=A0A939F8E2_9ACTN|nr:MarR family transcriptional regulator [Streptomyces beijiangensis]MBO0514506.1 MarR family transcriptional regulator [Streptomyces beijiangensis]
MSEFMDVYTRASKLVRTAMEAAMRQHGLHLGQNVVLAALWEQDGQTPGAIATATHVTTPTVVKMATRMTTAGLLTRRRDDQDNRLVRLYLTDAGRAMQQPIEEELRRIEAHITTGLTEAERKTLMVNLDTVARNAQTLPSAPIIDPC